VKSPAYVSHLDAEGPFCENRHVDWELLLPAGFVLLASVGALCAGLGVIHYLQSRGIDDESQVSVAMVAFALQYFLFCTITTLGSYLLLPTILLFLTFMALLITIWVGVQSHSRAGSRMALAAIFTLGAYVCKMSSELTKNYWWLH